MRSGAARAGGSTRAASPSTTGYQEARMARRGAAMRAARWHASALRPGASLRCSAPTRATASGNSVRRGRPTDHPRARSAASASWATPTSGAGTSRRWPRTRTAPRSSPTASTPRSSASTSLRRASPRWSSARGSRRHRGRRGPRRRARKSATALCGVHGFGCACLSECPDGAQATYASRLSGTGQASARDKRRHVLRRW